MPIACYIQDSDKIVYNNIMKCVAKILLVFQRITPIMLLFVPKIVMPNSNYKAYIWSSLVPRPSYVFFMF